MESGEIGYRKVWWNGKIVPESEARYSIYDSSLMFGDTTFTMLRTFKGHIFKLDWHLERLFENATTTGITIPYSKDELKRAFHIIMEENRPVFEEDDEFRFMINVSAGLLGLYKDVDVRQPKGTHVLIAVFPLRWTVNGMGKYFTEGLKLHIPNQRAIPSHLLDAKIKSRSRLHYKMANIETSQVPGAWPLLMDPDGYVAEGTGYNFFMVRNGKVYTPEPRNILRGVSRRYVMEMCVPRITESNIEMFDLLNADEAWITGTPFCMLPVNSIQGIQLKNCPGKIYQTLLNVWSREVGVDIEHQIKTWDKNIETGKSTPYQFVRR